MWGKSFPRDTSRRCWSGCITADCRVTEKLNRSNLERIIIIIIIIIINCFHFALLWPFGRHPSPRARQRRKRLYLSSSPFKPKPASFHSISPLLPLCPLLTCEACHIQLGQLSYHSVKVTGRNYPLNTAPPFPPPTHIPHPLPQPLCQQFRWPIIFLFFSFLLLPPRFPMTLHYLLNLVDRSITCHMNGGKRMFGVRGAI